MLTEHGFSTRARSEFLAQTIQLTHRLGARLLDVHPSQPFTSFEDSGEYLIGNKSNVWDVLLPGMPDLLNLAYFMSDVHHAALSVTLDLNHAAMACNLDQFLDTISALIKNLHLADWNPPFKREIPGDGQINWDSLMPKLVKLPDRQQATVELSGSNCEDVIKAVRFLAGHQILLCFIKTRYY